MFAEIDIPISFIICEYFEFYSLWFLCLIHKKIFAAKIWKSAATLYYKLYRLFVYVERKWRARSYNKKGNISIKVFFIAKSYLLTLNCERRRVLSINYYFICTTIKNYFLVRTHTRRFYRSTHFVRNLLEGNLCLH